MRNLTMNENLNIKGGNTALLGLTLATVGVALMTNSPTSHSYGYPTYSSYPTYSYSPSMSYQTTTPFCDYFGCGYIVDTWW